MSKPSQYRFARDRRAGYLARIPTGMPTDRQASLIEAMIKLEWASLIAESQGDLVGLREAREHMRLFTRLLGDFEQTLATPSLAKAKPGPPQLDLDAQLSLLRERRDGSA